MTVIDNSLASHSYPLLIPSLDTSDGGDDDDDDDDNDDEGHVFIMLNNFKFLQGI